MKWLRKTWAFALGALGFIALALVALWRSSIGLAEKAARRRRDRELGDSAALKALVDRKAAQDERAADEDARLSDPDPAAGIDRLRKVNASDPANQPTES